jgi:tetratricopeptide (TPR) repeat protein
LIPSAVIFRKKIAEKEGYFDESLQAVEDTDLWIKISDHDPFVGVPQALVRYRQHGSNMSNDPQRMVAAYYQILERDHGPPEGDSSEWPEEKKDEYTEYFRSASTRYLACGDFELSAYYFLRMNEINPEISNELGLWRSLARAHLPIEIRPEPNPLEWERAERDVRGLLNELDNLSPDSPILEKHYSKIAAGAYLAFADEAFRANDARRAFKWFWKASKQHLGLVLSRPYWGTLARGVTGAG